MGDLLQFSHGLLYGRSTTELAGGELAFRQGVHIELTTLFQLPLLECALSALSQAFPAVANLKKSHPWLLRTIHLIPLTAGGILIYHQQQEQKARNAPRQPASKVNTGLEASDKPHSIEGEQSSPKADELPDPPTAQSDLHQTALELRPPPEIAVTIHNAISPFCKGLVAMSAISLITTGNAYQGLAMGGVLLWDELYMQGITSRRTLLCLLIPVDIYVNATRLLVGNWISRAYALSWLGAVVYYGTMQLRRKVAEGAAATSTWDPKKFNPTELEYDGRPLVANCNPTTPPEAPIPQHEGIRLSMLVEVYNRINWADQGIQTIVTKNCARERTYALHGHRYASRQHFVKAGLDDLITQVETKTWRGAEPRNYDRLVAKLHHIVFIFSLKEGNELRDHVEGFVGLCLSGHSCGTGLLDEVDNLYTQFANEIENLSLPGQISHILAAHREAYFREMVRETGKDVIWPVNALLDVDSRHTYATLRAAVRGPLGFRRTLLEDAADAMLPLQFRLGLEVLCTPLIWKFWNSYDVRPGVEFIRAAVDGEHVERRKRKNQTIKPEPVSRQLFSAVLEDATDEDFDVFTAPFNEDGSIKSSYLNLLLTSLGQLTVSTQPVPRSAEEINAL